MQTAILLLACVAYSMASRAMVAKDYDPKKPLDLCKADGDYLLHPTNRCKYIRCTYGPEPWQDDEGNFQFYGVARDCPYGTAVSRTFYGHNGYGYNDGAPLAVSRLCSDRVSYNNGYGSGYGYDQCSVDAHKHAYGGAYNRGYAYGGYGRQGYGNQGYGNQGYGYQGYGFPGYGNQGYFGYPRDAKDGQDNKDDHTN